MADRAWDDFALQKYRGGGLPDILFSDILPFLKRHAGEAEIYDAFPDLGERQLLKAQAFYHAKVLEPSRSRSLSVLCDENISKKHVISCQKRFQFATSIAVERKGGISDEDVWAYACAESFDLIITHDKRTKRARDLTRIAVCAWHEALSRGASEGTTAESAREIVRLPMIVHLTGKASKPKHFGPILRRNLGDIFAQRAMLTTPVIRLNEAGVHTEIGLEDILSIVLPQNDKHEGLRRQEQWARHYLRRVLPPHKWADRETPSVVNVKRMITRAVATAARVPHADRVTHSRNRAA